MLASPLVCEVLGPTAPLTPLRLWAGMVAVLRLCLPKLPTLKLYLDIFQFTSKVLEVYDLPIRGIKLSLGPWNENPTIQIE